MTAPQRRRAKPSVEPCPLTPEERRALHRRRKQAAAQRSDSDFLMVAKGLGEAHPFIVGCRRAGIEPNEREVARWRAGRGRALRAAWDRWPRSKSLPRLRKPS